MHNYYSEQAGSGLGGYSGVRYQKGHGWFGRIIKGGFVPVLKRILPYLGKRALETGVGVAGDMMEGEDFKSSAKKRFKATGQRIEDDVIRKAKEMSGSGIKRRRKRKKSTKSKMANFMFPVKVNKRRTRKRRKRSKKASKPRKTIRRKSRKRRRKRKISFL